MVKLSEGIEKRMDEFVKAESRDNGKPLSLAEHVDIELVDHLPVAEALERLNRELPPGLSVFSGKEISLKTPAIADSLYETSYVLVCAGAPILDALSDADLAKAVDGFLSQASHASVRATGARSPSR